MSPKDLFSHSSQSYAQSRPLYPSNLYQWVYTNCKQFHQAWDCATGNGQVARELAQHFKRIYATDLSAQQLKWAPVIQNVDYLCEPAESCSLPDQSCDLITVAQAIHWFDFDKFYKQVYRVIQPEGILAVWIYSNICISKEIDDIVEEFYGDILGDYWDFERTHIENRLSTIPFPFQEIICPEFEIKDFWSRDRFLDYISSWSALKMYERSNGHSPLPDFKNKIIHIWQNNAEREVRFPVYMRMGMKL